MISSFAKKNKERESLETKGDSNYLVCNQCGGNGYMKSTPSCYHTCLDCLGRGYKQTKSNLSEE